MSEPTTTTLPTDGIGTLLGIWAHPDDEAYLSAGLMASAVRAGQRVAVVTATAGELGTADPERWPPGRLAAAAAAGDDRQPRRARRHRALRGSATPTAAARRSPTTSPIAEIADVIAAVAPDTIVTFGPDGMTGHPDHQAVSRWATAAWIATRPSARLWYATLLPSFHERWGALNDEVGLFAPDVPPPCTDDASAAAVVVCDGPLLDAKMAALDAHASQTRPCGRWSATRPTASGSASRRSPMRSRHAGRGAGMNPGDHRLADRAPSRPRTSSGSRR